jgi:hypothetical protein
MSGPRIGDRGVRRDKKNRLGSLPEEKYRGFPPQMTDADVQNIIQGRSGGF